MPPNDTMTIDEVSAAVEQRLLTDEASKRLATAMAEVHRDVVKQAALDAVKASTDEDRTALEASLDEKIQGAIDKALGAYQLAQDRAAAEAGMVQVGAAKHAVDEVFPRLKSIIGVKSTDAEHTPKPIAAMNEIEQEACKLHDNLFVIQARARDPQAASRKYLRLQGLDDAQVAKALDTYTTSYGTEWVNQIFSPLFCDRVMQGGKVLPLFYAFPMTAKAVTVTGQAGRMTAYLGTSNENTATTADTTGLSTNVAFSAEEVNIYQPYSNSLDEDAIIAVLPKLSEMMAGSAAEWLDLMCMDGCDSADLDADWSSTSDPRYAWDGLRKKAKTNTSANADLSTFNADTLFAIPAAMTGYADDPEKLSLIVGTKTRWTKLLTLRDSSGNSLWAPCNTPDSLNPIVKGQVGWLGGSPVTSSGLVKTDCNAAGVYDGSTTTKTVLYWVFRDAWWLGDRKMIAIESQRMVKTRNTDVVLSVRADFKHMHGTDLTTALGYNF